MPTRDTTLARGPAWKILGGALALLLLGIALIWVIWGFRWPPTAEVVPDQSEVEYPEPSPLAD